MRAYDGGMDQLFLDGILVPDDEALHDIERAVGSFKHDFFGDAEIVLHTADISRNRRGFETLAEPAARDRFQRGLNDLLAALRFTVVACVIHKRRLLDRHRGLAVDPYMLSLTIAWDMLRLNGTRYLKPDVLRRRIADFEFATKADGGPGLELADLVVTPLGRWIAGMPPKPDLDVVRGKLRRGPKGDWEGAGLVVLPKESGRGPLRNTRPRPV